jgi:hypothetical protein
MQTSVRHDSAPSPEALPSRLAAHIDRSPSA